MKENMKKNQFNISETMAAVKSELPEFTWDDIIRCGLSFCRVMVSDDNASKYKKLYWLSQKKVNELITTFE